MSIAAAVAQSCAQGCAGNPASLHGSAYPNALAILWPVKLTAPGVLKSVVGPAPTFTDTPTVDADGVTPGDGPAFTSIVTWTAGGTRIVRFTASSASADLSGDVEIGGGFYAYSGGLKFKDGVNAAVCATSWAADEVVTATILTTDSSMRISHGETKGEWVDFDGTIPDFSFASTAPGSLLAIEEWKTPRGISLLYIDGQILTVNDYRVYLEA